MPARADRFRRAVALMNEREPRAAIPLLTGVINGRRAQPRRISTLPWPSGGPGSRSSRAASQDRAGAGAESPVAGNDMPLLLRQGGRFRRRGRFTRRRSPVFRTIFPRAEISGSSAICISRPGMRPRAVRGLQRRDARGRAGQDLDRRVARAARKEVTEKEKGLLPRSARRSRSLIHVLDSPGSLRVFRDLRGDSVVVSGLPA